MHPPRARILLIIATLTALFAPPAAGEDRDALVIETRPLKLLGDGAGPSSPAAPPAQGSTEIATPSLKLIGDGASPPRGAPEPVPPLAIETRPLKLIGTKP